MGKKEKVEEHPKSLIEVMSDTMDVVTGYALAKDMTTLEASLILILNELRCIHWHLDMEMAKKEVKKK